MGREGGTAKKREVSASRFLFLLLAIKAAKCARRDSNPNCHNPTEVELSAQLRCVVGTSD